MKTSALFLIILLSYVSIDLNKKIIDSKVRFYSDLDIYTLNGINELAREKIEFPYIQIYSQNNNKKEITIFYNKELSYKRVYSRTDSIWFCEYSVNAQGNLDIFYEFIGNKRIVKLVYNENPDKSKYLCELKVMEANKTLFYRFRRNTVKVKPSFDISKYPLNNCFLSGYNEYKIKNGILIYKTKYYSKPNDKFPNGIDEEDADCYKVGKLSYFWWSYFGYECEKINCTK